MKMNRLSVLISACTFVLTIGTSQAAVVAPSPNGLSGDPLITQTQANQSSRRAGRGQADRNRRGTGRRGTGRRGEGRRGRDRPRTRPRGRSGRDAGRRIRGGPGGLQRWRGRPGYRYSAPPRRRIRRHRRARRFIDGRGYGLFLPPILGYYGFYDNCEFFWRKWRRTGRGVWRRRYYRCVDY